MSKVFAELILNTQDEQQIKSLLQQRGNEVDDAFIRHFLQTASDLTDAGHLDNAIAAMRRLYSCGTQCQRPALRANALWAVSVIEHTRNNDSEAIKRANQCLDECAKAPDQCVQVEFDILDLLATIQFEYEAAPDKAIETLKKALAKAENLKDAQRTHLLQQRIELLQKAQRDNVPFAVLLEDIRNARKRRQDLLQEIDTLSTQLLSARDEINSFNDRRDAAFATITAFQAEITSLTTTRDELQSRQRLFATALTAPLWIAAVRADIQAGRISELTLPLLERLRTAMPEHAQPLIAQIRARNGLSSDQPINLDGLAGEERLFAAVANSLTLDPAADPAAFESLLDAWDTYLSTPAGNSP